jgi:hypothetical protein
MASGDVHGRVEPPPTQRDVDLVDEQPLPMLGRSPLRARRFERLDAGQQLEGVALRLGLDLQALRHQVLVPSPREQENRHLHQGQPHHERRQRGAQHEQQDKVEARQAAINQGRNGAGGQEFAHDGVALQPHHQVAGGPAEEERIRKVDQVLHERRRQAYVEMCAQLQ